MVSESAVRTLRRRNSHFARPYFGVPLSDTMGPRGAPSFCTSGKPYNRVKAMSWALAIRQSVIVIAILQLPVYELPVSDAVADDGFELESEKSGELSPCPGDRIFFLSRQCQSN
ncbi:unnamed protein product [Schistocephalus solidus]|uniref:Uncharacterized protein n=1 Tax=Schistocephalus solidus TaxID=70667 RepID=A0A183TLA6_SCHSO|nr:unnamed protein product [Schistocephalus solidus]